VPQGKVGEEAFAVIRDAMKNKDRVALARVVLTDRGHLTAIEPFGKILVGTILRYGYEVRDERELSRGVAAPKIPNEMVSLPSHILDTKAGHFDPSQFRDEFETELRKLVKRKAAGKTIKRARGASPNVVDLMEALRQSVSGKRAAALRSSASSKKTSRPQSRKTAARNRKSQSSSLTRYSRPFSR
jgi:DNA end-binding protein Ku